MKDVLFALLGIALLAIVFTMGCTENTAHGDAQKVYAKARAESACIDLCKAAKSAGVDLSNGPCLSNQVIKDWVCDIAHKPRIAIDSDPQNQCEAFINQRVHHFIELDENCNLLQFY